MTSPNLSAVRNIGKDSYIRANYPGIEYSTATIAGADGVFSIPQILPLTVPDSNVFDISGINIYNIEVMQIEVNLTLIPQRSPSGVVVPTNQTVYQPFASNFDFGDSITGFLQRNNVWYTRVTSRNTISVPETILVAYSAGSMSPSPLPPDTDYQVIAFMNVQISGKIRQEKPDKDNPGRGNQ